MISSALQFAVRKAMFVTQGGSFRSVWRNVSLLLEWRRPAKPAKMITRM
jgi:hypothetical protein